MKDAAVYVSGPISPNTWDTLLPWLHCRWSLHRINYKNKPFWRLWTRT